MPVTIILGAQWGDEGKGRAVDWLASEANIVARYGGGDNAGHTVSVGTDVFKLHLLPSGILHPHVVGILGNGMVINPVKLVAEMEMLRSHGVDVSPDRVKLSTRAHLITPAHLALDRAQEMARGEQKIGTTLRGIGPAYLDKTGRKGIRAEQMEDAEAFGDILTQVIEETNAALSRDGFEVIEPGQSVVDYVEAARHLQPYLTDTVGFLHQQLRQGARVVCEGAQGTLLDIDHGSYPFVTSSSPSVGGALTGLGFGPLSVDRVIGVAKAFSTRVGSGAMPTELDGDLAERLRGTGENFWDEFGTTTGRPRRCGWLDAVMLRYAAAVNGFTEILLTKMDVLSGLDELKIGVAYELDGQRMDFPPTTNAEMERVRPVYETLPGWHEPLGAIRSMSDLPANARAYVSRIAELCETPVNAVSVGPERSQLVFN